MQFRVLLFAAVREALGRDSLAIDLAEGARVCDLLDELASSYPEIATRRAGLGVAVNHSFASPELALTPGDEVALIPPLGGG